MGKKLIAAVIAVIAVIAIAAVAVMFLQDTEGATKEAPAYEKYVPKAGDKLVYERYENYGEETKKVSVESYEVISVNADGTYEYKVTTSDYTENGILDSTDTKTADAGAPLYLDADSVKEAYIELGETVEYKGKEVISINNEEKNADKYVILYTYEQELGDRKITIEVAMEFYFDLDLGYLYEYTMNTNMCLDTGEKIENYSFVNLRLIETNL